MAIQVWSVTVKVVLGSSYILVVFTRNDKNKNENCCCEENNQNNMLTSNKLSKLYIYVPHDGHSCIN